MATVSSRSTTTSGGRTYTTVKYTPTKGTTSAAPQPSASKPSQPTYTSQTKVAAPPPSIVTSSTTAMTHEGVARPGSPGWHGNVEVKYYKSDGTPVYGGRLEASTIPMGATAAAGANVRYSLPGTQTGSASQISMSPRFAQRLENISTQPNTAASSSRPPPKLSGSALDFRDRYGTAEKLGQGQSRESFAKEVVVKEVKVEPKQSKSSGMFGRYKDIVNKPMISTVGATNEQTSQTGFTGGGIVSQVTTPKTTTGTNIGGFTPAPEGGWSTTTRNVDETSMGIALSKATKNITQPYGSPVNIVTEQKKESPLIGISNINKNLESLGKGFGSVISKGVKGGESIPILGKFVSDTKTSISNVAKVTPSGEQVTASIFGMDYVKDRQMFKAQLEAGRKTDEMRITKLYESTFKPKVEAARQYEQSAVIFGMKTQPQAQADLNKAIADITSPSEINKLEQSPEYKAIISDSARYFQRVSPTGSTNYGASEYLASKNPLLSSLLKGQYTGEKIAAYGKSKGDTGLYLYGKTKEYGSGALRSAIANPKRAVTTGATVAALTAAATIPGIGQAVVIPASYVMLGGYAVGETISLASSKSKYEFMQKSGGLVTDIVVGGATAKGTELIIKGAKTSAAKRAEAKTTYEDVFTVQRNSEMTARIDSKLGASEKISGGSSVKRFIPETKVQSKDVNILKLDTGAVKTEGTTPRFERGVIVTVEGKTTQVLKPVGNENIIVVKSPVEIPTVEALFPGGKAPLKTIKLLEPTTGGFKEINVMDISGNKKLMADLYGTKTFSTIKTYNPKGEIIDLRLAPNMEAPTMTDFGALTKPGKFSEIKAEGGTIGKVESYTAYRTIAEQLSGVTGRKTSFTMDILGKATETRTAFASSKGKSTSQSDILSLIEGKPKSAKIGRRGQIGTETIRTFELDASGKVKQLNVKTVKSKKPFIEFSPETQLSSSTLEIIKGSKGTIDIIEKSPYAITGKQKLVVTEGGSLTLRSEPFGKIAKGRGVLDKIYTQTTKAKALTSDVINTKIKGSKLYTDYFKPRWSYEETYLLRPESIRVEGGVLFQHFQKLRYESRFEQFMKSSPTIFKIENKIIGLKTKGGEILQSITSSPRRIISDYKSTKRWNNFIKNFNQLKLLRQSSKESLIEKTISPTKKDNINKQFYRKDLTRSESLRTVKQNTKSIEQNYITEQVSGVKTERVATKNLYRQSKVNVDLSLYETMRTPKLITPTKSVVGVIPRLDLGRNIRVAYQPLSANIFGVENLKSVVPDIDTSRIQASVQDQFVQQKSVTDQIYDFRGTTYPITTDITPPPPIDIVPPTFFIPGLPNIGGGGSGGSGGRGFNLKTPTEYNPSLVATAFGITGRAATAGGLGVRPIVGRSVNRALGMGKRRKRR